MRMVKKRSLRQTQVLARIYSKKDLIAPIKNAFFRDDEIKAKKTVIERQGNQSLKRTSVGSGYEPPKGHIPWNEDSGAYCNPLDFVRVVVR